MNSPKLLATACAEHFVLYCDLRSWRTLAVSPTQALLQLPAYAYSPVCVTATSVSDACHCVLWQTYVEHVLLLWNPALV